MVAVDAKMEDPPIANVDHEDDDVEDEEDDAAAGGEPAANGRCLTP